MSKTVSNAKRWSLIAKYYSQSFLNCLGLQLHFIFFFHIATSLSPQCSLNVDHRVSGLRSNFHLPCRWNADQLQLRSTTYYVPPSTVISVSSRQIFSLMTNSDVIKAAVVTPLEIDIRIDRSPSTNFSFFYTTCFPSFAMLSIWPQTLKSSEMSS